MVWKLWECKEQQCQKQNSWHLGHILSLSHR
uniref:Uncharacterized protein n=1 Tax=Arundo donax TaxID=35708 RepID=A0A0A9BZR5_ARUDO